MTGAAAFEQQSFEVIFIQFEELLGVSSSAIQMAGCVSLPGAGSVAHRRFAGVTGSRRRVRPGTFLQVAAAGTGELFAEVV